MNHKLIKHPLLTLSLFVLSLILSAGLGAPTALASCGGTTNVATESELNAAIADFNSQTSACSYTIALEADISLTASTTTINNATAEVELLINGAGFRVDGQSVSLSGNGRRPFTIAANTVVAMDAITITRGNAEKGGAIWNAGSLTLSNSTLDRNRGCSSSIGDFCDDGMGGAIFNRGGTVNISTSTISNNRLGGDYNDFGGGGIHNTNGGTVNITHSQVVGNNAGAFGSGGGGIYNDSGTVTVNSSTFSQNVAWNGEDGGAIYNNSTLIVSNSTFSNNEGLYGGALYNDSNGTATLVNNTIATNIGSRGDGIYNEGQVMLNNSILGGDQIWNANNGTITADANNLFGHSGQTSASAFRNFTPGNSDIVATSDGTQPTALTDILDTTLQNNGGATETHALVAGSPAVNGGNNALAVDTNGNPLTTDQRGAGFPRIVGNTVDIGAFESEFAPNSAPVAGNDAYSTTMDTPLTVPAPGVLVNDSDPDGDSLTSSMGPQPGNGSVSMNPDGSFTYSPNPGFTGVDTFSYSLNDGKGAFDFGLVTITVEAPADTTPPVISPNVSGILGNNNWYISNVDVSWTVSDDESDIETTSGCETTTITSDTAGTTLTCEATSEGGTNSASVTIKRDATSPTVSVTGVEDGATYILGSVPTAGCDTSDALSGVATVASLSVSGGNSNGVGNFSATCDGASDNAGNNTSASVSYSVVYDFGGFTDPIDPQAVNQVKAGQTVPVKFSLNGDQGMAILTEGYPASHEIACDGSAPVNDVEETDTAGNSGLSYDPDADQYSYKWKTEKGWKGTCRKLIVQFDDGSQYTALFQFK